MTMAIGARDAHGRKYNAGPAGASTAERARAFARARRHSRLVGLLRIGLPLGALAILAVYTMSLAIQVKLNLSGLKVGAVTVTADDLIMKDPSYFGVTKDGGRYEVRAKRAVVGLNQSAPIKLIDIGGDLVQSGSATTKLTAKHGLFDNGKGELELFDGIDIAGSNGLTARLLRAVVYSKDSKVVSDHPVMADTPTGSVRASKMVLNNKTRLVQFRGQVAVRLAPSVNGTVSLGGQGRQPVDISADELDIDDAQKTAHFRGNVIAKQGDTTMDTPYLFVKYEGKAADGLAPAAPKAEGQGTRVTFLWARSGVVIAAGSDRRVSSDLADFNVEADTALFVGNVTVKQDKNVLKGRKLFVDRKAGKSRLEAGGEGSEPAGRIAATFYQSKAAGEARARPKPAAAAADAAQNAMLGSFKSDPTAPMEIEADSLDFLDASRKAIFTGNVKAQQGDLVIRTVELTAFYSGQMGFGLAPPALGAEARGKEQGQLTRIEARKKVLITSKDDQNVVADWANFDVKANTALLGGGVVVMRGRDIAEGPLLKIDLTTGVYRFEAESEADPRAPPAKAPAVSSAPSEAGDGRACPPGKQCLLFYPKDSQEKGKTLLRKPDAK